MISRNRRILATIAVLAIAGLALSLVSLQHHYASSRSSYCDFGAHFNCDMVNRSIYSEISGVPVALIGVLGYGGLLVLTTLYGKKQQVPLILFAASLAGAVFAFYLTYIEGFVLAVWCVLCLSSLGLILAIAALSGLLMRYSKVRT
ncbi:MAG: vitamin K epoxide reductase family protein [Terriglobales bacterium]